MLIESVNVGAPKAIAAKTGRTGIDKLPVTRSVEVRAPGPALGFGGLLGDSICDAESHGGDAQAVYAYAREDLDWWQRELGEPLRSGWFGENLTTRGVEVTGALLGERWRVGRDVLLEVTAPRIPCVTFATWMRRRDWLKTFTQRAVPGAYLRVVAPGAVQIGDPVAIEFRPDHAVTVGLAFRALTLEPHLFAHFFAAADYLLPELLERAAQGRRP